MSLIYFFGSCPHTCHTRYIFCTRTHSLLLTSSIDERFYFCLFIYIQKSGSFWSVEFMAADTEQVYPLTFGTDFIFSISLDRIYMK